MAHIYTHTSVLMSTCQCCTTLGVAKQCTNTGHRGGQPVPCTKTTLGNTGSYTYQMMSRSSGVMHAYACVGVAAGGITSDKLLLLHHACLLYARRHCDGVDGSCMGLMGLHGVDGHGACIVYYRGPSRGTDVHMYSCYCTCMTAGHLATAGLHSSSRPISEEPLSSVWPKSPAPASQPQCYPNRPPSSRCGMRALLCEADHECPPATHSSSTSSCNLPTGACICSWPAPQTSAKSSCAAPTDHLCVRYLQTSSEELRC